MLSTSYTGCRGPMEDRAEAWRKDGHEVDVVRIEVERGRPGASALHRIPGYARNLATAASAALSRTRYERIVAPTSPPLAFAPLVLRTRLTREELVIQHLDIFPENAAIAGVARNRLARAALRGWTHALLERADRHETLSAAMARTLRASLGDRADIRVEPLPPSAGLRPVPRGENAWREAQGFGDAFVVMYAGNLGRMYDFEPLIAAARALYDREDILFAFVGAGHGEPGVRRAASELGNVRLLPPQPEERLAEVLAAGDAHVVPLRPGAEGVMWPSKVEAIRAVGRPIIAVGWGDGIEGVRSVKPAELAAALGAMAGAGRRINRARMTGARRRR